MESVISGGRFLTRLHLRENGFVRGVGTRTYTKNFMNTSKLDPFSENIVFVDTEFSSLDPYVGEILSVGIVKYSGEELYFELECEGNIDPWVKDYILPLLQGEKIPREEGVKRIKEFIGDSKPYMVSYVNQFDAIYLYKLTGTNTNPFHWLPIDFASMLFAFHMDPESYYWADKSNFYKEIGVDHAKYRGHHALDDAKLLREVYLKMVQA